MIEFQLSHDVLGSTRFAFSPLAEVAASLGLLARPQPAHLHAPWLQRVRPLLDEVDMELLLALVPKSRWAPAFLYPRAHGPETSLSVQLEALTRTDPADLAQDLVKVWEGRPIPRRAADLVSAGAGGPALLAEAIEAYWEVAITPYWTRICGVLEDDVSYRATLSLRGGLFDMLSDLHPEVRLRENHRVLTIDKPAFADATYEGAVLTLVPSVFVWPRLVVSHTEPADFELTYAARGVGRVWEGLDAKATESDRLGALLGRSRATILAMTQVPMSTSQIARRLGQSPGSVNQHLAVLRDAGMVTSWRSGRSVLYRQTALGASVLAVAKAGGKNVRAVSP